MDRFEHLKQQLQHACPNLTLLEWEPMCKHTSFQIGGPVHLMAIPNSEAELITALRQAREVGIVPFVLGNGTNLLCQDEPTECFVIKTAKGLNRLELLPEHTIYCGAGVLLSQVAAFALQNSLTGLEFASGIPGTLGGGIAMNAGAYGGELKDVLVETHYLTLGGEKGIRRGLDQQLGYRTSVFSGGQEIITSGMLRLVPGDPGKIRERMETLARKRTSKQPLEYPSAGSTFKRPADGFAAALIDQCGLKGLTVGGAQVSEKHAGFVINRGGATCADVLELTDRIRTIVEEKTGVRLELEVKRMDLNT